MKKFLTISIALIPLFLFSQEVIEKTEPISKSQELRLNFKFADQIIIKTWDKNEVLVRATVSINDNEDNDHFKLNTSSNGNMVKFVSKIKDMDQIEKKKYVIEEDEDGEYYVANCESIDLDMTFEVFAPGDVILHLSTINGDVDIFDWKGPSEINTINGYIDSSIDPKLKVNFDLSTINGGMYSNLDLDITDRDEKMRCLIGGDVEAMLNNGGVEMVYETINGDIYLRKK